MLCKMVTGLGRFFSEGNGRQVKLSIVILAGIFIAQQTRNYIIDRSRKLALKDNINKALHKKTENKNKYKDLGNVNLLLSFLIKVYIN